jgi:peptidoglycan/LPS O-acetylase OafA/YrhL
MLLLSLALLIVAVALYVWVPALLIYWMFPWPVYVLMLGAVAAAVASRRAGWRRWATIGLSGLVTVLFVLYTMVFSRLSHGELAVRPGDAFPDFTLQTSTKEPFSPAQLRGQRAALYIFYRGDW